MATPSHVDLSVLWVPIMPETSKLGPEMEKAGKQATEDFGKGSSGLGEKIHDSFTKATGKVKDVFHKAGSDAGESMSDGFKEKTKGIEDAASESGTKAGGNLFESFVSKTGGLKDFTSNLGDQLGKNLGGKLGDALKNIPGVDAATDSLQKIGDKAQQVGDSFNSTKGNVEGFGQILAGLPGKLGAVGAAIGEVGFAIAGAVEAAKAINQIPFIQHWFNDDNGVPKSGVERWLDQLPGIGPAIRSLTGDKLPTGQAPDAGVLGGGGGTNLQLPANVSGVGGAGAAANPAPLPGPGRAPAGGSSHSFYNDWYGSAAPSSFASIPAPGRDVGSDKGLTPTSKSVKQIVSEMFPQISDIGGWRPPDGYNEHSSGQALDVMIPNANTPQGKALGDQISQYVLAHAKELGVDYTIWQHGQHNPDGSFQMYPDRGSPTQNHMDHVHIHTVRGAGSTDGSNPPSLGDLASRGSVTGGGAGGLPTGKQHDPLYVMSAADAGSTGGAAGGPQDQAQQLGQGFLDGVMQSVGLDGSVFKGFGGASNPLQFGSVKMATGLLNWGLGMAQQRGAGLPGMGGGSHGSIPIGPNGAQNVPTGDTHIYNGPVGGLTVTQNGVQSPTSDLQAANNAAASRYGPLGNVPGGGNMTSSAR